LDHAKLHPDASTAKAGELSRRPSAISHALREAARQARTPAARWQAFRANALARRTGFTFASGAMISFFALVVIPTFIAGLYLAFVASDQYVSEARFAVRGGDQSSLSVASMLGMTSSDQAQNSLILVNYLQSRGLVEQLDKSLGLRKLYARDGVDFLSRFNVDKPIEDLTRYWRWHSSISMETISGVVTVAVRAFTPQDALAIANEVIVNSEKLVNDLSDRSRRDALRTAKTELDRAENALQDKVRAMRDLRNSDQLLDANIAAEVMTKMLGELRLSRINLEQEYSALMRSVKPDSPNARVLSARITSLKSEIAKLEGQMTQPGGGKGAALSDAMSRFNREKLELDFAQKQYVAASAAFERARVELESQQVYLATFLKPVLAQEPLYPKRWWLWSIILVGGLALWGAGVGAAVLVRNHGAGQ
jgi:capsular polysaccharide transport system permease protein